jgi:hypothetical protein
MSRSAIPRSGDDDIMTPDPLALAIVQHFKPKGSVCDPCQGEGAFFRAFQSCGIVNRNGFDIKEGYDFLTMGNSGDGGYDWIITNPPWSKMGDKAGGAGFLSQAMRFADNIVFLIHVNAMFTNARRRMMREAGYHIREIAECDRPWQWRSMGLQLAAIHFSSTPGTCVFSRIEYANEEEFDWG